MYSNSAFGDLVKLLPRDTVAKNVERHGADKWNYGDICHRNLIHPNSTVILKKYGFVSLLSG